MAGIPLQVVTVLSDVLLLMKQLWGNHDCTNINTAIAFTKRVLI
jgi:hypothetical protein